MPKFAFEITQTVLGLPDPGAYPSGLSNSPELDTCAMVVIGEFLTEDAAKRHARDRDEGWESDIWMKHCPSHFMSHDSVGGLDVYYIGPVSDEEAEKIETKNKEALGDDYIY